MISSAQQSVKHFFATLRPHTPPAPLAPLTPTPSYRAPSAHTHTGIEIQYCFSVSMLMNGSRRRRAKRGGEKRKKGRKDVAGGAGTGTALLSLSLSLSLLCCFLYLFFRLPVGSSSFRFRSALLCSALLPFCGLTQQLKVCNTFFRMLLFAYLMPASMGTDKMAASRFFGLPQPPFCATLLL